MEQLVTGRKNLTRPPLWISCLWLSFVIPNWVPYIQSLGRFWHVNGGLSAPKPHDYSPKCYRGQKWFPEMHCWGVGGRDTHAASLQTEVCLTVWNYVNGWASVWTPNSLHPNGIIYGWSGQSVCGQSHWACKLWEALCDTVSDVEFNNGWT